MITVLTPQERTVAEQVVTAVALTLKVAPEDIKKRWRKKEAVLARDFCAYILRMAYDWKVTSIQAFFEMNSHATVIQSSYRHESKLKRDNTLALQYNHIKFLLSNPSKLIHLAQQLAGSSYSYRTVKLYEKKRQSRRYFLKKCNRIGTQILNNIINDIRIGLDDGYLQEVYSKQRLTPHFLSLLRTELDRHGRSVNV